MRLTCPNCGAEYEVPDEVIPTSGRDVQCSNCGDTWYQYHPDFLPEEDDLAYEADDFQEPIEEPAPPLPEASGDDEFYDVDEDDFYEDDDEEDTPPPPNVELRRRSLNPEVQSILREEAQYEERARDQEMLESQPDLGLTEPVQPKREEPAENQSLRIPKEPAQDDIDPHSQSVEDMATAAVAASRRDLLPDIEEINSSLRRKGDTMRSSSRTRANEQETRSGARRGFISVLVILAVGAILYLQAPNISTAIPALKGPMTAYVTMIDKARGWLDTKASSMVEKLDEAASEDAPATE